MKFLENKGNMKVEEPAEQENKPIVCLKQLNNQFIFTGNEDSSANFWHLGSMNIGQSVQREIFEYNFRDSSFNGIIDIVSEGYYGIALVGRYVILLNWLNFQLLEAKEFDNELTCIQKRSERFKYFIGDTSGQVIYVRLNKDTFQLEEDPEGSIRSKSQRNMHGHDKPIEHLHLIKEKHQLVVASQDGIRLWDVKSKKLAANIEGEQKKHITFIGYSKARLYVAGEDQQLKIYDLAGKLYRSIKFQYPIKCGVFLNSSELALSDGKNLKILNVISNDQDYYSVHKNIITHICRISDYQFITADSKGSLYKWTLMSTESDPSLQYRVTFELSNNTQAHCSNFSPERITKFFSSNQSPQRSSFHSQKLQQMKAKIESQRALANQGIYEGSQKMVGDLYTQENYYLKAKVRNLESKVSAAKGEYSESHRDFIQNSSFSRQNISLSQISASGKSAKDTSSVAALKTQKAQIKVMEQKLKEQEELVLKIQEEEQVLRNNAEKKVKQEKKAYMERNVDDIKLNSQRFESKIPLIQNDIDLLRKQLNFMNDRLNDRQGRIRDRSSSLQKKQSELQQFHNDIQKRDQDGQEELNKKRERTKQLQEQEKREIEQQKMQNISNKNLMRIDDEKGAEEEQEEEEENQSVHDDQIDIISQELDQTIKNSQNFINSQRNLNSSQQNRPLNADESNDSNFKGSQVSSRNMNYKNDDINNSLGSSSNSCVLNNKKITSSTQARNIMKSNREEININNQQDNENNLNSSRRGNQNNDISDIEEEQDSYKYTNRRSSPNSNYANSQAHVEVSERESKNNRQPDFTNKGANFNGNDEQDNSPFEDNLKYSFIEGQFKKLQSQVKQLQQNYEELKHQQDQSPQRNTINMQQAPYLIPAQTQVVRPGEFKPIIRIQQMSPVSLNSSQFANSQGSPTQLQSALRLNNFIGQGQTIQQSNRLASSPPPAQYAAVRSLSPNMIINNNSSLSNNQISQSTFVNNLNNSPAIATNTSTSFYVNSSPQRNQFVQKSQNTQSPGQILLLNNSLNQSQCEGLLGNNKQIPPQITQSSIPPIVGQSNSQQKQRPSSQLSQRLIQAEQQQPPVQNNSSNTFNIFKQNSSNLSNNLPINQSINAQLTQSQPTNNNQINQFTQQSIDFINSQKQLLAQQQQQLKQSQNKAPSTLSSQQLQNLRGQDDVQENETTYSPTPGDRRVSSKMTNRQSKASTPNYLNEEIPNVKLNQYEQENEALKRQLFEQTQLIKDLQVLMEKQKEEIAKRDEMLNQERENAQILEQKQIEQCGIYESNINKLSDQVMKQSEFIHQIEQEKQTQLYQYSESLKQIDRDKNQLISQINQFDAEIQQKNADILYSQNNMNQMNITLSQLKQMTTYEEVERLTKQIKVLENMIDSYKNESKSQKQLLMGQEKMIVDSKRMEIDFQQIQLQKQQLLNENDILKSRLSIVESENKNLHQRMHTIREEIDGKYQAAILELQKLMYGQTNKQMNLTQSIENIKSGVLSGVDINALDKLIEMSSKKQSQQTTQNLKSSANLVSSIPISQMQQSNRMNNHQMMKMSDQMSLSPLSANSRNEKSLYQAPPQMSNTLNNNSNVGLSKIFSFKNQELVNMESTSSIKTFNPDDQVIEEYNPQNQGRFQSKSVSPLNFNNRMLQTQQSQFGKVQKSDRSNQNKYDSGSIRTFKPDGELSQSDENSESDYYSNFSNVQFVSGANSSQQRKSAFKNQIKPPTSTVKDSNSFNQKQVILVDEYENHKKNKDDQGMCAQQ